MYIHVGYHKTATSLLQRQVFPKIKVAHESYPRVEKTVGYKSHKPRIRPSSKSIRVVRLFNCSPSVWNSKLGQRVLTSILKRNKKHSQIIISDEDILGDLKRPNKYLPAENIIDSIGAKYNLRWLPVSGYTRKSPNPHLFKDHLKNMKKVLRSLGVENLKIIVGIRRQDLLMASLYSQLSDRIWSASQKSFEEWVKNIISSSLDYYHGGGIHLDYHHNIDFMLRAVGEDNLLVLPVEMLKEEPKKYLYNLYLFLSLDFESGSFKNILQKISRKPKKSNKSCRNTWNLKKLRSLYLLYSNKVESSQTFGPTKRIPVRWFDWNRENKIHLSNGLRKKIRSKYEEGNKRLNNILSDVDLSRYGYMHFS